MVAGAQTHCELVALDSGGRNICRRIYLQGPVADGASLCGLCATGLAWPARLAPRGGQCLTRRLDNILERFALHISLPLLRYNTKCTRRKLRRGSANMRREQQVWAAPERVPFRQWLGIRNIERCSNSSRIERIHQSICVYNWPARGVHQQSAL